VDGLGSGEVVDGIINEWREIERGVVLDSGRPWCYW
jgi:hypothetical protein